MNARFKISLFQRGMSLGRALERLTGNPPARGVDHRIDGDRYKRSADMKAIAVISVS
jgi:hypothetical protein